MTCCLYRVAITTSICERRKDKSGRRGLSCVGVLVWVQMRIRSSSTLAIVLVPQMTRRTPPLTCRIILRSSPPSLTCGAPECLYYFAGCRRESPWHHRIICSYESAGGLCQQIGQQERSEWQSPSIQRIWPCDV